MISKKRDVIFFTVILVFYSVATYLNDIFWIRLSRVLILPLLIAWYLLKHKIFSFSFVGFLFFSFVGHIFLLALHLGYTNIFGLTVFAYTFGTLALIFSIYPYIDFSKVKSVANIFVFLLVVFSVYLMYSSIFSMSAKLMAIDVFFLIVYGMSLVMLGLFAVLYYLFSGSNKSLMFMVGVIALIFSDLIGGLVMYYLPSFMLIVTTRAFYILALVALYYYSVSKEEPKFKIEEEEE